jgi:hypothetical protein
MIVQGCDLILNPSVEYVPSCPVEAMSLSVAAYLCTIRNILRKVTEQGAAAASWYLIARKQWNGPAIFCEPVF